MKITKRQLRRIIREEKRRLLELEGVPRDAWTELQIAIENAMEAHGEVEVLKYLSAYTGNY